MTTETPTRTLAEEYVERWRAGDPDHDNVLEGLGELYDQMMGAYYQTETGDYPPLGNPWRTELEEAVTKAGELALTEHVVPAMAAAAVRFLLDNPPPEYLVVFPGSEQLRSDLALLESGGGQLVARLFALGSPALRPPQRG